MIEDFKEFDFKPDDSIEVIDKKIQDKLSVSILDLQNAISSKVKETAESLTHDFISIAPFGEYDKLLEDNDSMAKFLKEECSKPEYWKLISIAPSDTNKLLIQFSFICSAVDSEDFKGFVFVSKSGKIRHAFAQNDN